MHAVFVWEFTPLVTLPSENVIDTNRQGMWHKLNKTTFLILSCAPFCPQNSLNSSGHGPYKVSKVFHKDAGSCWLQCFPQLCQAGWIPFGWWTILDTHGRLLSVKNPAELQFLTQTGAPGTYYHTHVSIVSSLKNFFLFCLITLIYTDWSGFNKWRQLGTMAFISIHLVKSN